MQREIPLRHDAGAQLLGQAVRLVREHGGSALHINAPASDASRVFLKEWGFFADGAVRINVLSYQLGG